MGEARLHERGVTSPETRVLGRRSPTPIGDMDLGIIELAVARPDELSRVSTKLSWLRSQVIGDDAEIETPFGRRRMVYADHTASGRPLRYIEKYVGDKVLPFYGNSHTNDSHVGSKMTKMAHQASAYIKKCMGGGAKDAIIFCGSGATAAMKRLQEMMGIAIPSIMRDRVLATLKEVERWVVFVGPYEHHSNILSWRNSLAQVVEIGIDKKGGIDMDQLRAELASRKYANRPLLGSFSACSNVTGIYTDTRELARLLHQHGAFVCFDFAASGPYVDIDMRSGDVDGYDAVFLSTHKFVGGPGTPGILLMSEALYGLKSSAPTTCGGGTVAYVNGFSEEETLYYESIEEREDAGTPPIIQKIRAALAFWVKEYVGHEAIQLYEQAYAGEALKRLSRNQRLQILGSTTAPRQPIVSFLVFPQGRNSDDGKPLHGRFVAKLLNDLFGVQARGGCACAGPYGHHLLGIGQNVSLAIRSAIQDGYEGLKPGWTRVSFTYYMSREEFEFVIKAIEFVAEHGLRFLPLYRFNWNSGDWTFKDPTLRYQPLEEGLGNLLRLEEDPKHKTVENHVKDVGMPVSPHGSYLDAAYRIAESMTMQTVPDDIDPNLVLFAV